MVVKIWSCFSLKICTMWRSEGESRSLKTYVPAGKTWAPTPGTSNGALNVTMVILFVSSADAPGNRNKQTVKTQTMIKNLVTTFMATFSLGSLVNGRAECSAGPGASGNAAIYHRFGSARVRACGNLQV